MSKSIHSLPSLIVMDKCGPQRGELLLKAPQAFCSWSHVCSCVHVDTHFIGQKGIFCGAYMDAGQSRRNGGSVGGPHLRK